MADVQSSQESTSLSPHTGGLPVNCALHHKPKSHYVVLYRLVPPLFENTRSVSEHDPRFVCGEPYRTHTPKRHPIVPRRSLFFIIIIFECLLLAHLDSATVLSADQSLQTPPWELKEWLRLYRSFVNSSHLSHKNPPLALHFFLDNNIM